jgi:putative nucleotidyltransferase with HDIG domain
MTRTALPDRIAVMAFAHAFVEAWRNRALHGRDHEHTRRGLESALRALQLTYDAGIEPLLHLQFSDDTIHYDGAPLVSPSLQARGMLAALAARQVAALAFHSDICADELNRLFDLLMLEQNEPALLRDNRDRALRAFGIRNVRVMSRTLGDPGDRSATLQSSTDPDLHIYQDLAESLYGNHSRALRDESLALDAAAAAVEHVIVRLDHEPSGLLSLAAQDNVDRFTVGHSVRVALLALQVARATGVTRDRLVEIGTAALLHDIGKSKVPQDVLFKQGRLEEEEWRQMALHPQLGAEILLEHGEFDDSAVAAAFCHHMRPDGQGYPRTARSFAPSSLSNLVRVCDVFEALTSVRPYKRALTPIEAFAVMRRNACDYDPRWFNLFVRTIGLFPAGSRILLADQSLALVLGQGKDPSRPIVRLLSGPDGGELPADTPDELAIGDHLDGKPLTIAEILTHDRTVAVPDPETAAESCLDQAAHRACLPPGHHED